MARKQMTAEDAVRFLQSLVVLSVETQQLLRDGHVGTAADRLSDMEDDLRRAADIINKMDEA